MQNRPEANNNNTTMSLIAIFLPVIAIYITLVQMGNTLLTFIIFYGVIAVLLPFFDMVLLRKMSYQNIKDFLSFDGLKKNIITGTLIGLVFAILIIITFMFFSEHIINPDQIKIILANWNIDSSMTIYLLIMLIVVNPVIEEFFWRGYIFKSLLMRYGSWTSICISALGYTSYHLITTGFLFSWTIGIILSVFVFGVGLIWAKWHLKSESIYPSIISHLLADAGIMIIYLKLILPIIS